MYYILTLFIILCSGENILTIDNPVINDYAGGINRIAYQYCPFNDMSGINPICVTRNHTIIKNPNIEHKLPIILGVTWDPIKGKIMLPFLDLTYYHNNTYTSNSGKKYRTADQISITKRNINENITKSTIFNNFSEYISNIKFDRVKITSGVLGLPTDMMKTVFKYFETGNNKIVESIEYRTNMELKLNKDHKTIIPFVQSVLDGLPGIYNKEEYFKFIDYWGTMVVVEANSGALANQLSMVRSCYADNNMLSNIDLMMLKRLYAEYQTVTINQHFSLYAKVSSLDIVGGDPKYFNLYQWKKRITTIDDYPVLTSVKVVPISEYITNITIKANMEYAVSQYYAEGDTPLDKLRKQYYKDSMESQHISMGFTYHEDYNMWYYVYPNMNPNINMVGNSINPLPSTPYGYQFILERNLDNQIKITVKLNKGYEQRYKIVQQGSFTRNGCSKVMIIDKGFFWPSPRQKNININTYVCMGCVVYVKGESFFDPNLDIGCDCPVF